MNHFKEKLGIVSSLQVDQRIMAKHGDDILFEGIVDFQQDISVSDIISGSSSLLEQMIQFNQFDESPKDLDSN